MMHNSTIYNVLNTTPTTANSTLPADEDATNRHVVGMTLALGGNLLISISLSVQKKAHNRLGHESDLKYLIDKWWWLGMLLMIAGEVGNFMAYGFAPASLVAPLGSVAVIANAIIAVVFLGEPLTMPSMLGVTLVIIGSIILISFSVKGKPILTTALIVTYLEAWPFLLYISIEAVALGVLLYLKYKKGNEHLVVLLLLVSLIASVTIIAAKAMSTMISESILLNNPAHMLTPVFWVSLVILPVTTITQIRYLNRAMQLYDVSDVAPVNFMFFTVSAILAGAMFYQEFSGVGFDRVFMFVFGCIQSFIGVYIITKQEEYKSSSVEDNRKRTATGDSGLDPGSSVTSSDSNESSYSCTGIFSLSDSETPPESKLPSTSQVENTEETPLASSNVEQASCSSIKTCNNVLKDLVQHLKESEKISRIQPESLSDCKPSTSGLY